MQNMHFLYLIYSSPNTTGLLWAVLTAFHFPSTFVTMGTYLEETDAQMQQSRFSDGAPQPVLVKLTDEALTMTSDGRLSSYQRQPFQVSYYTMSPIAKRQRQMAAISGNPFHDHAELTQTSHDPGMTIQGTPSSDPHPSIDEVTYVKTKHMTHPTYKPVSIKDVMEIRIWWKVPCRDGQNCMKSYCHFQHDATDEHMIVFENNRLHAWFSLVVAMSKA